MKSKNMKKSRAIVLIVDDQYKTFQSLPRLINSDVFSPLWVPDDHHGLEVLQEKPDKIMAIITDLKTSGMGGGGFLHRARQIAPGAAVLVTAPMGPFLYHEGNFFELSGPNLKKNINTILLSIAQKTGIMSGTGKNKGQQPKKRFGVIIGRSQGINKIYNLIENLKDSSATVLVLGESGTGKELVARMIHQTSPRKKHPFVAINCGAIPANLMESELFGHERGAFTTAVNQRKGKFEIAHKGVLFLDEISELDLEMQVKLLRVLQEKEFQRVGGNKTYKTDVRIIAATSQDLKKDMQKGNFRDDLFYRLNVVPIHIPPLRERREDIRLLLGHFCRKAEKTDCSQPSFTDEALEALLNYSYPGNIRELINIVERLSVICPDGKVTLQDLPDEVREETDCGPPELIKELPEDGARLCEVERELIMKTLRKTSGNKLAAARMLGITRRLLYLRLSQYELSE